MTHLNTFTALTICALFGLSACVKPMPPGTSGIPSLDKVPMAGGFPASRVTPVAPANAPSGPVVDNFARSFLNTIQPRSIAEEREYCGYIYVNGAGQLQATEAVPGTFASCSMPVPRAGQGIIASYHTHSSYRPGYDNEVPSVVDLESDFAFGIDGYVSTPGGRVWLVDFQTQTTRQVCGRSCVYTDPGYDPIADRNVATQYSLDQLRRR